MRCIGKVLSKIDKRQVIDCKKCGYAHLYPLPTPEELKEFYENVFVESTPL